MLRIGSQKPPLPPEAPPDTEELPPEAPPAPDDGGGDAVGDPGRDSPAVNLTFMKLPQKAATYRSGEMGPFMCSNCHYFQSEDSTCTIVDGDIDPEGLCNVFVAIGSDEQPEQPEAQGPPPPPPGPPPPPPEMPPPGLPPGLPPQ